MRSYRAAIAVNMRCTACSRGGPDHCDTALPVDASVVGANLCVRPSVDGIMQAVSTGPPDLSRQAGGVKNAGIVNLLAPQPPLAPLIRGERNS